MIRISDLNGISAEAVVHNTLLLYVVECMEKIGTEIPAAVDGKFGCTRSVLQDGRLPGLDLNAEPSDYNSRMLSLILGHRARLFSW